MSAETISSLLEHVLILRELSVESISELAEQLPLESFPAGEHLYQQGAVPDAMYLLLEGQVERWMETPAPRGAGR